MKRRHTDRRYSRPLGHLPTLLAALGLWWVVFEMLTL